MSAIISPTLTVSDLDLMPDDGNRYELIEGEILVSRAPSLSHQEILGNMIMVLKTYLTTHNVGKVWATPGVIFDNFNAVIPDVVFVSSERIPEIAFAEKVEGAPDLAIEILSPGSENVRRDRSIKLQTYGKFGVAEYWIVDGFQRKIEIFRSVAGELSLAAELKDQDLLASPLFPEFSVAVAKVFEG